MQVEATKRFYKDVENLELETQVLVLELIQLAKTATSIKDLPNLKKMKGFKNAYRIRLGDYRVGFLTITKDSILFKRCLLRKDIYRYFP